MTRHEAKTLLMLCHDFPPVWAGGVVRPLKFVKYLADFGWRVVVVTSEDSAPVALDESFLREVPAGTEIIRTPPYLPAWVLKAVRRQESSPAEGGAEGQGGTPMAPPWPKRAARSVLEIARRRLFVPDRQILWKRRALRAANRVFMNGRVDALFTTSPPQSAHVIGLALQKRYGVPWVADFRDHWMNEAYYPHLRDPRRFRAESEMERAVVWHAAAVLSVTAPAHGDFLRRYPTLGEKFHLLPNGFDEEDFAPFDGVETDRKEFRIRSFGSVGRGRNPAALLEALLSLKGKETFRAARVEFFGHFGHDRAPWTRALGDRVSFLPSVPHAGVAREMRRAGLLLVLQSEGSSAALAVPGKLYECGRACVPILGLFDEGPAAALVREHRLGWACGFSDSAAAARAIEEAHALWKSGACPEPSAEFKAAFSRRAQAERLARLLDKR